MPRKIDFDVGLDTTEQDKEELNRNKTKSFSKNPHIVINMTDEEVLDFNCRASEGNGGSLVGEAHGSFSAPITRRNYRSNDKKTVDLDLNLDGEQPSEKMDSESSLLLPRSVSPVNLEEFALL